MENIFYIKFLTIYKLLHKKQKEKEKEITLKDIAHIYMIIFLFWTWKVWSFQFLFFLTQP